MNNKEVLEASKQVGSLFKDSFPSHGWNTTIEFTLLAIIIVSTILCIYFKKKDKKTLFIVFLSLSVISLATYFTPFLFN